MSAAVEAGILWLSAGPASLPAEEIPAGVLSGNAVLRKPPAPIPAPEILPDNLPEAWKGSETTALTIAGAVSQKCDLTLPGKTVRDAIGGPLQARFLELTDEATWPCDLTSARAVRLKVPAGDSGGKRDDGGGRVPDRRPNVLIADAEFEPSEIQELADAIPGLLKLRAKSNVDIRFRVRVEVGDGKQPPGKDAVAELNVLLGRVKGGFAAG